VPVGVNAVSPLKYSTNTDRYIPGGFCGGGGKGLLSEREVSFFCTDVWFFMEKFS
jgi:hypothetical protein